MKRLVLLSTIVLLAIVMIACTKKVSMLHVIQATNSEIVGNELILRELNDTVVWFADRPVREAGYMQVHDFLKSWDAGKDSFEKDPPNAVLILEDERPVVVELILVSWNQNQAVFKIKKLTGTGSDIPRGKGRITLYIDATQVNRQITD